jgi:hypothetical protein
MAEHGIDALRLRGVALRGHRVFAPLPTLTLRVYAVAPSGRMILGPPVARYSIEYSCLQYQ